MALEATNFIQDANKMFKQLREVYIQKEVPRKKHPLFIKYFSMTKGFTASRKKALKALQEDMNMTEEEANKVLDAPNEMVFNHTVLDKINEPLNEDEIQEEMEKILSVKGTDLFSKKDFLGGDSLFDKIIQYNTDCAKLGKFNPLKSTIEHTVDKRIHYLADNPQFTFQLGKVLQKIFEENGLPESEQPKQVISDVGIMDIRQDSCPSKVTKEEYCGDGKKALNERKRDQALCALQRGTFDNENYPFMTCKSSNVCATKGGKKAKGKGKTKGKKKPRKMTRKKKM